MRKRVCVHDRHNSAEEGACSNTSCATTVTSQCTIGRGGQCTIGVSTCELDKAPGKKALLRLKEKRRDVALCERRQQPRSPVKQQSCSERTSSGRAEATRMGCRRRRRGGACFTPAGVVLSAAAVFWDGFSSRLALGTMRFWKMAAGGLVSRTRPRPGGATSSSPRLPGCSSQRQRSYRNLPPLSSTATAQLCNLTDLLHTTLQNFSSKQRLRELFQSSAPRWDRRAPAVGQRSTDDARRGRAPALRLGH